MKRKDRKIYTNPKKITPGKIPGVILENNFTKLTKSILEAY
jgi:hypothetical protein